MNDISIHRTRQQFTAAVNSLHRATVFTAWRGNIAIENPALAAAQDFDQALAAVLDHCQPKTALFILRDDSGRGEQVLRVYRIVASTKRYFYRAAYDGGRPVRVALPDAKLDAEIPVLAFEPVAPFDALRDDPVGRDLTLVEG